MPLSKTAVAIEKAVWPLNGDYVGRYNHDFGVPLTGIESVIPGWDAFNPLGTNFVRQSVSDNKLLIAPTTTTLLFSYYSVN